MAGIDYCMMVRFWGVRGSTPTPAIENMSYGGNTACIEIRLGSGEIFIIDAGTGIRSLGTRLIEEFKEEKLGIDVLLSHFHWDHIQGIPFFAPLYDPENRVTFHASTGGVGVEKMLSGQMQAPYFPVDLDLAAATKIFNEIQRDEVLQLAGLTIRPFELNHPQGATGYRLECGGAVVVYASDLEHGDPRLDNVLRDAASGADILIYDSQFTPREYENHTGWGHSTWLEATRVARDCDVEQLILFHHDPSHDDRLMHSILEETRLHFPRTLVAQEGWNLAL